MSAMATGWSEVDEYLDLPRVRTHGFGTRLLTLREVVELRAAADRFHAGTRLPGRPRNSEWQREQADRYQVSPRTIQRYLHERLVVINIGGWRAAFRVPGDRPPVRMSSWERDA